MSAKVSILIYNLTIEALKFHRVFLFLETKELFENKK